MKLTTVLASVMCLYSQISCAEMVLGSVDIQQLSPYISAQQQIAMQSDPTLKADYQKMQQDIKTAKQKSEQDSSKMSKEEKIKYMADLATLKKNLSQESMSVSKRLVAAQNENYQKIQSKIEGAIAVVAKEKHINTVLPKQVLLYTNVAVDITPDVLKKLS